MKPNLFLTAIIYIATLSACLNQRHTTIATSTNGNSRKIEYAGLVTFHQNSDNILSMAPHSWLKYKDNGLSLKANCDENGKIYYSLNGSDKTSQPTAEEKSVLASAARFMAEYAPKHAHS